MWFAIAVALLAVWYAWAYGDCTRYFLYFDDYWVLRDASRMQIGSLWDVRLFFLPGNHPFLLYRPLSTYAYSWVLQQLFDYDVAPYHAVQLATHFANALLTYLIASRLLASRSHGLAAALLYALASGHVLAVYWLALFTTTGTTFWYLACLYAWLTFRGTARRTLCLVIATIALLHGELAVGIPIALTLTVLVPGMTNGLRATVRDLLPIYFIMGAYAAAKLLYMKVGLPLDYPEPAAQAFILHRYGLQVSPLDAVRQLGFYFNCATNWLYAPTAAGALPYVTGCAFLISLGGVGWWARNSPNGRVALFGMLLFVTGVGPVLFLPNHQYPHYIGVAALGTSLAIVALVRALPMGGKVLVPLLTIATLVWTITGSLPEAKHSREFSLFRSASAHCAAWLLTVENQVRRRSVPTREVVVPWSRVTWFVFELGDSHRVFYDADYTVHLTKEADLGEVVEGPERLLVARPIPVQPGTRLPGQQKRWDWLR